MNFERKLTNIIKKNKSFLCVGLDSDFEEIPPFLKREKYPQFVFNKKIIEETNDQVCAYKINNAFYASLGEKGIFQLKMTFDFLNQYYPEIISILDAKIGDIGHTNEKYCQFVFEYLRADGITVNPYLGQKALEPFLKRIEKGIFILCHTSNSGADEFQDLLVNRTPLYQIVANNVVKKWNKNKNCMLVVGATYPEQLRRIRKIVGPMTLLIPGLGSQGGSLSKVLKFGLNYQRSGLILNYSREIIFSSNNHNFAEKARKKAKEIKKTIDRFFS